MLAAGLHRWLLEAPGQQLSLSGLYLALLGLLYLALGPYLRDYLSHQDSAQAKLNAATIPLFALSMVAALLVPPGYSLVFAWEAMALLGYLLIAWGEPGAQTGARWFLLSSRLSGAGVLLMVVALSLIERGSASLWPLVFVGALVGFGVKAAIFPLSLWLTRAHPVAPSPISALLSGGMTKLGLYGLLLATTFQTKPPEWMGWTLVLLGLAGAVYAPVRGLAEQDYKAVLAYSSVENLNLMLAGAGALMLTQDLRFLAALVFLQLSHAAYKGLLFLGSAILPAREIGRLGGLWKRAPVTAGLTLFASVAAASLPPLAGFLGEWLLFLSFLGAKGLLALSAGMVALAGVLASVLYLRAFGLTFLGSARSEAVDRGLEAGPGMRLGMSLLATFLMTISLFPAFFLPKGISVPLLPQFALFAGLLVLLTLLVWWLKKLQHRSYGTWDCGYTPLEPVMQPSPLGYSEQVLRLFPFVRLRSVPSVGVLDPLEQAYQLVSALYQNLASAFQRLQSGSIHLYLLLQFLALLVVLAVAL